MKHILWRALQSILVLLIMSVVVHALMGLMPGDPIDLMIATNPHLTPQDAENLRALYGVGQPWPVRWLRWIVQFLQGNLGYSRLYAQPVSQIIGPAIVHTALLAVAAMLLSMVIGLGAGIAAGAKSGGWFDRLARVGAYGALSLPTFWAGLMLTAVFSVWLGWLPASGMSSALPGEASGILDIAAHLVLPAVTLSIGLSALYMRQMRAAMMAEAQQPYIRTARAKGCSPLRVVLGHQLRNALLPITTIVAMESGSLLSGALVTETIFAWPGLGRLSYNAIMGNDYNLALSALLLATALTLGMSIVADLAYGILDPRTKT